MDNREESRRAKFMEEHLMTMAALENYRLNSLVPLWDMKQASLFLPYQCGIQRFFRFLRKRNGRLTAKQQRICTRLKTELPAFRSLLKEAIEIMDQAARDLKES